MTDNVIDLSKRVSEPTQIGDLLYLFARTDQDGADLRSDNSPSDESSSNATPAGGQSHSPEIEGRHSHANHVYVVYWPDASILKIGISATARWEKWLGKGVEIAALPCGDQAPAIERELLGILAHWAAPAFEDNDRAHRFSSLFGKPCQPVAAGLATPKETPNA